MPSTPPAPIGNLIQLSESELRELSDFVEEKYGIVLIKKKALIEGRLSHMLRERGIRSFREYMALLQKDANGSEITDFLNRITTNYSYFMRENDHFAFLKSTVLPYLEAHRPNRVLRIWSAGCSTGQEPYTLAMAIDEYFGPRKSKWDTSILATDISKKVLDKAKTGIYQAEDLRDVSAVWKNKYFTRPSPDTYQVTDTIRKEVVYRPLNLMESFPFRQPFDLILCRNVMIYFDAETKKKLIDKFYNTTVSGGYLFIGHSEGIDRNATQYQYIQPAIYRK